MQMKIWEQKERKRKHVTKRETFRFRTLARATVWGRYVSWRYVPTYRLCAVPNPNQNQREMLASFVPCLRGQLPSHILQFFATSVPTPGSPVKGEKVSGATPPWHRNGALVRIISRSRREAAGRKGGSATQQPAARAVK